MKNKYANGPIVRMAKNEKIIVRYICDQLDTACRNSSGKHVYAKNMDQVIKDVFGVKKFTKTLDRARYNEGLMITLMKRMDTETLWQICRSKEYYRIFCNLIALDAQIVKLNKKYHAVVDADPSERTTSTKKIRRMAKDLKTYRKMYKRTVKALQDIFDIDHRDYDSSNSVLDTLDDFLNRHDDDGDIFFDSDYSDFDDAVESMDAFVRRSTRKGSSKRAAPARYGALGIFDDTDDDDDIFDDLEDGQRHGNMSPETALLYRLAQRLGITDDSDDDIEDDDDDTGDLFDGPSGNNALMAIVQTIREGFDNLGEQIGGLQNMLTDEDDDDYSVEMPVTGSPRYTVPTPQNAQTIQEMMAATENHNKVTGVSAMNDDPSRPTPGAEIPVEGEEA